MFPQATNKIVKMGRIHQKAYKIICDGNGRMIHKLVDDPIKTIERLHKLLEKGAISQTDFDQKKKELLDNL